MKDFFVKYKMLVISIFVVLILSGCLFLILDSHSDNNLLTVSYSSNEKFTISNLLPMTDKVGKKITLESNKNGTTAYLEFEVSASGNKKTSYEIYLVKDTLEVEVPVKFVKVYLTDDNDVALKNFDVANLPTYYDLRISDIDPSGKLLYSGTIKNQDTQKFRLRMWVADTYELTTDVKKFSVKVFVKEK